MKVFNTIKRINESVKKAIKHHTSKDYAWNSSLCACECDKDCNTGAYLKNCTCTKNLPYVLVVIFDEIADAPDRVHQPFLPLKLIIEFFLLFYWQLHVYCC